MVSLLELIVDDNVTAFKDGLVLSLDGSSGFCNVAEVDVSKTISFISTADLTYTYVLDLPLAQSSVISSDY